MSNTLKIFLGWLLLFGLFSLLLIYKAQAQEDLIELSIASGKHNASSKDLNQLFNKLGINEKTRSANPCIDLEEYTHKWCSFYGMKISSKDLELSINDRKFLIDALKTKLPCETLALHIGKVCEQENLMQIIQHFSRQK